MKNLILSLLLIICCFNTQEASASCVSTINQLNIVSHNNSTINLNFSGTAGPNFMQYEFDLFIDGIYQSTLIEPNPNATSISINYSIGGALPCLIKIKSIAKCIGGESGDPLDIILTIDEVWDCMDTENLCTNDVYKVYNNNQSKGTITEQLTSCLCAIKLFEEGTADFRTNLLKGRTQQALDSKLWLDAIYNEKTEFDECTNFIKTLNNTQANKTIEESIKSSTNSISIYPNPTKGKITIDERLIENLEVFTTSGKKVQYSTYYNEIVIDNDIKGLLIIKSISNGQIYIEKVLVK